MMNHPKNPESPQRRVLSLKVRPECLKVHISHSALYKEEEKYMTLAEIRRKANKSKVKKKICS